ncbi:MAG TPA: hypothetical protein VMJ93_16200 [Verrucomicrobiae bacterium]|nr:hypothetical protein [Verrucomicrobiae bacterium]
MKISQAREIARQWAVEEAERLPGFRGAFTAGSCDWLPDDATLPPSSDFDVMVVFDEAGAGDSRERIARESPRRAKFVHRGLLLEASYLRAEQFESPAKILGDYHLAPNFSTSTILSDPSGDLAPLHAAVSRDYAKRGWVRRRCANASENDLRHLRAAGIAAPLHERAMACLFAAGVTTHVLLVAGLKNPTVRARYASVRKLLEEYGRLELHEELLEFLGAGRITRAQAETHLAALATVFDAASQVPKPQAPFASDIAAIARPIAIEGSADLIARGLHREAMFWIGVTHSRCRVILEAAARENPPHDFRDPSHDAYRELLADLGLASDAEIQRRREDIERALPRIIAAANEIIAANSQVEPD